MKRLFCSLIRLSVVILLLGCGGNKAEMISQLEQLEAVNRSGEPLLNDSLAESLVEYFDRHGDSNERMRARYMLGRTYFCMGELPRALEMYIESAGCADTTSTDCNYKVLSRIHAQSAVIFDTQILPQSQLRELQLAEYYAKKGKDTIQAIECYAQQAGAYGLLHKFDSLIFIREKASTMYSEIGRKERSALVLIPTLIPLLSEGDIEKSREYIKIYETNSGVFDENGNIETGREVYYYMKGEYYLLTDQIDSAEYMFRKELRDGKDLNNQIAGCKGLQKVFTKHKISDSIAKYATLSYELNDSAYSLSEMQNMQILQASYNYNHQKQLAKEKEKEARKAYIAIVVVICFGVLVAFILFLLFNDYKRKREIQRKQILQIQNNLEKAQTELLELREINVNTGSLISKKSSEVESLKNQLMELRKKDTSKQRANLEDLLEDSDIVKSLKTLLSSNPVQSASIAQMRELKKLVNEQIPTFYDVLNSSVPLRSIEYEVCLLVRCHFKPAEISKLVNRNDAYIANLRKGILLKVFGIKGVPGELDQKIMQIS